jgi:sugar phosphate isomerase/epimerase
MCWPVGKAERRYAGVTHIDVANIDGPEKRRIHDLFAKHGITISGLGYYPNPLSADPGESQTAISQIKKIIEGAAELEVPVVNTFIGRDQRRSVSENLERFAAVWPEIISFADSHKIKVGIENCPMLFTQDEWPGGKNLAISPPIWRHMYEIIPSANFGLNYDPSHFVWQQMDGITPMQEFRDRIFHVHAKDARLLPSKLAEVGILAEPLAFHQPCLPGRGDVPWDGFFAGLRAIGYDGPVCVEVEDREYEDSKSNRIKALRESFAFLKKYVAA